MEYFEPGLREISRAVRRLLIRLRTASARARLVTAETTLGLLAWQQADYDSETQDQVRQIIECEREQGRHTNDSAQIGNAIRELTAERDAARRQYDEKRAQLAAERERVVAGHPQIERQLAEKRATEPTFEKRMPELDRELREVQKLYSELLSAEPQTQQIRNELIQMRERSVSIPNEKSDLRTMHMRTVSEIHALEAQLARDRQATEALDKKGRELERELDKVEYGLAGRIQDLERQRATVEKTIHALEGAKRNPYAEVGRVLADSNIAPVNQPHALEDVRDHRFAVQKLGHMLNASLAESAAENRVQMRQSLLIWLAMALVFFAFLVAIMALG